MMNRRKNGEESMNVVKIWVARCSRLSSMPSIPPIQQPSTMRSLRVAGAHNDGAGAKDGTGAEGHAVGMAHQRPCAHTRRRGGTSATMCAVASVLLAFLPVAEAMVILGIEIGPGVGLILLVALFLFVVPCISKIIHIIRKFPSYIAC